MRVDEGSKVKLEDRSQSVLAITEIQEIDPKTAKHVAEESNPILAGPKLKHLKAKIDETSQSSKLNDHSNINNDLIIISHQAELVSKLSANPIEKKKKKKKKDKEKEKEKEKETTQNKPPRVVFNVFNTIYDIIKEVGKKDFGWKASNRDP